MRNLKRALSLTLASVMLLGMMVVGSSAAAGYDDVADTDNVEAIEVLQAVEVMVGDERGFGPERPVNRAEMAVVMGKLLNLDYNYYEATCPFNDVYDWARGWVGACYANGIVSGRGEGVYDPGTTVTAVEAASMLMRALGYFKYQSDYASGFEVSTVLQANKIRLFDGVNSSTNEPLTRNQVAQMALNALKSGMVEPDGNALNFIDANGNVIATGGKVNYVFTTSNKPFAQAISKVKATSIGSSNDSPIVELGEQLYDGKLKLDETRTDVFGRPSRYWEYDGKEIGSYAKKELMVFDNVGEVTGLDLYNLLGKSTIDDYTLTVTVDGIDDPTIMAGISGADRSKGNNTSVVFGKADLNRNNKAAIGGTGTGVLMQVFVDHETDDIHVAVINTYLAIADKTYDEKKEEASVKVYAINRDTDDNYAKVITNTSATSTPDEHTETFKLGIEDFSLVKDIKKDDAYLVNVADGAVQAIEPAEVLADSTISAFKKNDHVVSGGTDYKYASTAGYNYEDLYIYTSEDKVVSNLKDITYNIYLDPYGNLIGLKANETPKNYVFLASIDRNSSYISNKTATATAIFLDGTSATIEINMDKSEWRNNRPGKSGKTSGFEYSDGGSLLNTWATYTKSGDLYTVKEVWNVYDHDTGKAEAYRAPDNGLTSGERNTTKLAQFHDITRNGDEITLKNGLRLDGGFGGKYAAVSTAYNNVYGDSDSVYLTSELGTVNTKMGIFGIIKSAETVHTGIDGTSINVWTDTTAVSEADKDRNNVDLEDDTISKTPETDRVSQGVYTLYNDKGIVIAAMVVGEGSSSKDLVYVTSSDVDLESDNGGNRAAGDGLWTWTREVVRDGEKVMLSEVGDAVDALSSTNMKQHTWYQVKVDGNGNVTKAEPAFEALGDYDYLKDNKGDLGRDAFVDDYADINNAVEEKGMDTVLYHTNGGPNVDNKESKAKENYSHKGFYGVSELEVKGKNVLAVTTEQGSGIYFRSDVNVVLTYYNRNKNQTEVILGEGVDDLKEAVDFVNDNTKMLREKNGDKIGRAQGQSYYVSALIENGAATTVVIHDTYNNYEVGPITGTVTVKFKPGDYSDERNVFYDGNEKLSYDNGRITHYNNLYDMFRVTNGDGEVKVTRSSSNNDYYGESNTDYVIGYYEDGSGLVIGHVSRSRTTLTFTADKNCILFDSRLFLDVTTVTPNKGDDLNSGFVVENDGKEQNLDSLTEYFLVGDGRSLPKPKAASYTDIGAATKFESGKTYTVEVKVGSGAYKVEGPFTCTTEGWLEVPVKLFKDLDEFYKYNDSVNGANIDVFFGQIMEVKIDDEPENPDKTYSITVTGDATASKSSAKKGETITLTYTGADLKEGESLQWTYSANVTDMKETADGVTFTMPAGNVTVDVKVVKEADKTYTVTVDTAITHGTVVADKLTELKANDTVTLTVTPGPADDTATNGYKLGTLTVKDADGTEVTTTKVNDTTYTFTMPAKNVTVTATFVEKTGTEVDESVKAVLSGGNTVDFYKLAGAKLTEDEIDSALKAAFFKTLGVTPTEISIDKESGKVTATLPDGTKNEDYSVKGAGVSGSSDKPVARYKVTVGAKSEYVDASEAKTLKGFGEEGKKYIWNKVNYASTPTDTAKYVLTADKDGIDIAGTEFVPANYATNYELTFVEAVELKTALISGTIKATDAVIKVGTKEESIATLATGDVIVKDASLTVKVTVAANSTVSILVNDDTSPKTLTNNTSEAKDMDLTVTVNGKSDSKKLELTAFTGFTVTLNGTPITKADSSKYFDGTETDMVAIPNGVKIAGGQTVIVVPDDETTIVADANTGGTAQVTEVTVNNIGGDWYLADPTELAGSTGEVKLATAYKFENANGADCAVTEIRSKDVATYVGNESASVDATDEFAYVIVNGETSSAFYVETSDLAAGTVGFLGAVKDGSVVSCELVETLANGDTPAHPLYKVTINGDVTPETDIKAYTLKIKSGSTNKLGDTAIVVTGLKSAGTKAELVITLGGYSATEKATVAFKPNAAGTTQQIALGSTSTGEVDAVGGELTVGFDLTNGASITAGSNEVGTLTIVVGSTTDGTQQTINLNIKTDGT